MKRYQDIAHDLHRHVVTLTKAGEFEESQAARTVLIWFAMNIANKDDASNGLRRGFVMSGCISHPVICQSTGLGKATVSRALTWLHARGFIRVRREFEGKRQRIASVEVTSYDSVSEADRKAWLAQQDVPQPPAPRAAKAPRLRLVSGA